MATGSPRADDIDHPLRCRLCGRRANGIACATKGADGGQQQRCQHSNIACHLAPQFIQRASPAHFAQQRIMFAGGGTCVAIWLSAV
jgi:hypothetical protein